MKIIYCAVSILISFISCTMLKNMNLQQTKCNENIEFRNDFFFNIDNVENYTLGKGDRVKFKQGLDFLSKYVTISYNEMLNYSNSYTNYNAFIRDKENWIKWYEENKCSNIQNK